MEKFENLNIIQLHKRNMKNNGAVRGSVVTSVRLSDATELGNGTTCHYRVSILHKTFLAWVCVKILFHHERLMCQIRHKCSCSTFSLPQACKGCRARAEISWSTKLDTGQDEVKIFTRRDPSARREALAAAPEVSVSCGALWCYVGVPCGTRLALTASHPAAQPAA